jgi:hypothetical protein
MNTKTSTQEKELNRFITGPEELNKVLKNLSEEDLELSREKGKWTIRQLVHHIVDADDIWKTCIKAALGNSGCNFDISWYLLDNRCSKSLEYSNRPIDDALMLFQAMRKHITHLINHLPQPWDRYITISRHDMKDEKKFTVSNMIKWQNTHLQIHLRQIIETRKVHNKQ